MDLTLKVANAVLASACVRSAFPADLGQDIRIDDLPRAERRSMLLVKSASLTSQLESGGLMSDIGEQLKTNRPLQVGLAAALAGGGATALGGREEDEGVLHKSMRVLRNAALAGGLGAGATAALSSGVSDVSQALPVSDVDPVTAITHGAPARVTLGAAGAGTALKISPIRTGDMSPRDAGTRDVMSAIAKPNHAVPTPEVFDQARHTAERGFTEEVVGSRNTSRANLRAALGAVGKQLPPDKAAIMQRQILHEALNAKGPEHVARILDAHMQGMPDAGNLVGRAEMLKRLNKAGIFPETGSARLGARARHFASNAGFFRGGPWPWTLAKVLGGGALGATAPDLIDAAASRLSAR